MSEDQKTPGTLSKVEGHSAPEVQVPEIAGVVDSQGIPLPPPQVMAWMAQVTQKIGPDPDTTKILAENERHAEDNRLEAYRANLDKQDRQSQRDQEFRLSQMKHAQWERYVILFAVLVAFATGILLSFRGNSLGNSIMIAMLPVLGILISGKIRIG
jgi:hypothetical protein